MSHECNNRICTLFYTGISHLGECTWFPLCVGMCSVHRIPLLPAYGWQSIACTHACMHVSLLIQLLIVWFWLFWDNNEWSLCDSPTYLSMDITFQISVVNIWECKYFTCPLFRFVGNCHFFFQNGQTLCVSHIMNISSCHLASLVPLVFVLVFQNFGHTMPQTRRLSTAGIHCLTTLEARDCNLGVSRAMLPLRGLGKNLLHGSLLASIILWLVSAATLASV